MVLGWRRAFCTSIPRDPEPPVIKEKQEQHRHQQQSNTTNPSPKLSSKFGGFFSNPTTPRLQAPPVSSPGQLCPTTATATATVPAASVPPESPKLQCKTAKNSPTFFHRSSNPSSPRSPSTFSLLKSSLRLSKSRCGICLQSVKAGQGMAIFTAECSHTFHFPCIASHMKKQSQVECPVCSSIWKEMPVLSVHNQKSSSLVDQKKREIAAKIDVNIKANINERKHYLRSDLKVYNDDEPLMSPTSVVARFNPIPESDENGDEDSEIGVEEFQGFSVNATTSPIQMNSKNVEVRLLPEAAVVSIGRSYETYAIILKVRAPQVPEKALHRAPIDLVTVLDVSGSMNSEKMQMMKRAMRLVVSSLSSADRLSIVAFSATSKRLLPLRRMTTNGRRSACRIIDALTVPEGTSSASDALKKAAKVLEDRRERNPAGSIMLLSDRHDDRSSANQRRQSSFVFSTRYAHLDIPVHSIEFNHEGMCGHAPTDDAFVKCVGDLLSVVVQDLRLQLGFASGSAPAEIAAVYSYTFRVACLGSGSPKVGDLYAEEERELVIELKVPSSAIGAHHLLSVRSNYIDPSTQEVIHGKKQVLLVPHPHAVKSSAPSIQRLRNLFLTTRALAESRRLVERSDLTGAHHMLSSARALLLQSSSASAKEFLNSLKAELSELHRRCQSQNQRSATTLVSRREIAFVEEKGELLTPTSAWRAAERLAKVGIMRKSLNRVSDLHGFEDARF